MCNSTASFEDWSGSLEELVLMGGEGGAVFSEGWVVEVVGTEFKLTSDGRRRSRGCLATQLSGEGLGLPTDQGPEVQLLGSGQNERRKTRGRPRDPCKRAWWRSLHPWLSQKLSRWW